MARASPLTVYKLKHEADRFERSSLAFAFHMDSQREDKKRVKAMSDTNDITEQLPTVPDIVNKFMGQVLFHSIHYAMAAFRGAVSRSVTHSVTPSVDIVNSQMQLKPAKYKSVISVDKNTISAEGSGVLFTDEMITFQCFQCYIVKGWFKCCGLEISKTRFAMGTSEQNAEMNWDSSILGGPAVAEFVADVFLCPCEAYRIRKISDPSYADWEMATGQKFVAENDAAIGLFFNFGPMLYKQTTYTKTKFCTRQKVAKGIRQNLGTSPSEMSKDVVLTLSLVSGIVTDVAAPAECPDSEFSLKSNLNDLVTVQDVFALHVCPIRILKRMPSNTTITRYHEKSVFPVVIPLVTCQVFTRIQTTIPCKWQLRTAHPSNKNFVCGDFITEFENEYIFEFATEVNEENTNENDDLLEETYMMIYVKMIFGKTISIKCEGKQTAAVISDEVERRSLIPGGVCFKVYIYICIYMFIFRIVCT